MLGGSPTAGTAVFTTCTSGTGNDGIERNDTTRRTTSIREDVVLALIGVTTCLGNPFDIRIQENTTIPSVHILGRYAN